VNKGTANTMAKKKEQKEPCTVI